MVNRVTVFEPKDKGLFVTEYLDQLSYMTVLKKNTIIHVIMSDK